MQKIRPGCVATEKTSLFRHDTDRAGTNAAILRLLSELIIIGIPKNAGGQVAIRLRRLLNLPALLGLCLDLPNRIFSSVLLKCRWLIPISTRG